MNTTSIDNTLHSLSKMTDKAADKAETALDSTKRMANQAIDSIKDGVDDLRYEVPSKLQQKAAQVEDLARRGIERAKETSSKVKDQYHSAEEQACAYIQDAPLKSVLIAAGAGAAIAALITIASRRR